MSGASERRGARSAASGWASAVGERWWGDGGERALSPSDGGGLRARRLIDGPPGERGGVEP